MAIQWSDFCNFCSRGPWPGQQDKTCLPQYIWARWSNLTHSNLNAYLASISNRIQGKIQGYQGQIQDSMEATCYLFSNDVFWYLLKLTLTTSRPGQHQTLLSRQSESLFAHHSKTWGWLSWFSSLALAYAHSLLFKLTPSLTYPHVPPKNTDLIKVWYLS